MADSVNRKRTSISLEARIMKEGQARAKRLRYRNFSVYIEFLIEQDLAKLEHHVVVREDPREDSAGSGGSIGRRGRDHYNR